VNYSFKEFEHLNRHNEITAGCSATLW